MGSTSGTSSNGAKTIFGNSGSQYLSNMKASITGTVWSNYAFGGTDPYKVLIDRDGNLRGKGSMLSQIENVMDECLGI